MAFFNPRKRVLIAGNEGVALFGPTASGGIEREISLSWEVPNFDKQLTDALAEKNQSNSVLILFDADHAYRKGEDIPKLNYFDRPLFIKRKLDQAFPNYPVRASFEIAAAKKTGDAKEQPSYLFIAISDTERLDKVGKSILDAGVPVAGLGLLPVESEGLVTTLSARLFAQRGRKSRWAVLIGQHETGGLRQVVVKDGRLALTRMTPVSEAGLQGAGWVEDVIREFKATLTYIARFGYTPAEGLDVIVIGGEAEKRFFEEQKFLPGSNFLCIGIAEALRVIGSKAGALGDNNFGDALHAAWASQKRFLAAPVKVAGIHRIMIPRLVARTVSAALALSLVLVLGFALSMNQDYGPLKEKVEQRQSQKKFLALEYEQESKVFDAFPVKPGVIRGALAVQKFLDNSSVNITPTLNRLHSNLGGDIKLDTLSFDYQPPGTPGEKAKKSLLSLKKSTTDADGTDRGTVKIGFRFTLTGNVTLERKVMRAEKMVETMSRAFPGYDVQLKSQFGNISKGGTFSGELGRAEKTSTLANPDGFAEIEMQGAPL